MQTRSFTDFDAFADSVRDIDAVMMLQNPKRRSWAINHVYLPNVHVQLGRLGSGNIVEGQSWSSGYMLYLPLTDACEYSANGTVVEKGSFIMLEPGSEFCVSTKSDHDWCSVLVPTQNLASNGDREEWSSDSENMRSGVSRVDLRVANQFRALVDQTMTAAAAACSKFESSPAATHVEAKLVKVVSAIFGQRLAGQHPQEGQSRVPRQEIIRRCMQLLDEHEHEFVQTNELAAVAGVSIRTLRRAFNEYFGVSPKRYLQLRQLHHVRHALKVADLEEVSVSDVLFDKGVWEFGRFAARYRRLFGELPSETLRKKKQR